MAVSARNTDGGAGTTTYLVTGSTGLVGRNLLERLLRREGARVLALVRPASRKRLERLRRRLPGADRVEPLLGDVREPSLGFDPAGRRIDQVVHAAAVYDLLASHDAVWETNVNGTANVVAFANRAGVSCLHHVSTIGVAGRHKGRFHEGDLECGQEIDNPYFRSKWYAERIVRSRAEVPTRIYRPGVIVGSAATGEMTKIDGAYFAFSGVRRMARLPTWLPLAGPRGGLANVVPADWVAEAIDTLMHASGARFRSATTFHLVPEDPGTAADALNAIARAAGAPQVRWQVDLRVTRPLARVLALLPGSGRLRDRFWAWAGVPPRALKWRDFDAVFDRANLNAGLDGTAPCPPFERYVERLYQFWLRSMSRSEVRT